MKIVHATFNLRVGGLETMMIDIMNRQVAEGADVTLLLINEGHDDFLLDTIDPRVKIERLHRSTGSKNPIWLWRFNHLLAKLRPDIVHLHNKQALGLLCGPRKYKVAFTYHCTGDINKYSSRADKLFAISEAVKADVASRGEGSATVIYNGINTSEIGMRDDREAGCPVRLVQIGSLKELKGQDLTLEALAGLPDCTVDFYGDGLWREYLKEMTGKVGVSDRVRFHGAVSRAELYAALPRFDIALLPSRSEGFGLALAEPMAAGVPVVSVDLPGPLEVLDGGRLGTVFACGDSDSLRDAIRSVISDYPTAIRRAKEAAKYVRDNFDIAATTRNYLKNY